MTILSYRYVGNFCSFGPFVPEEHIHAQILDDLVMRDGFTDHFSNKLSSPIFINSFRNRGSGLIESNGGVVVI